MLCIITIQYHKDFLAELAADFLGFLKKPLPFIFSQFTAKRMKIKELLGTNGFRVNVSTSF